MAKEDYYVKCPFYKKNDAVHIRCEGISACSRVILQFNTKNQMLRHMNKFCKQETDYRKCDICKMLLKKYEEMQA